MTYGTYAPFVTGLFTALVVMFGWVGFAQLTGMHHVSAATWASYWFSLKVALGVLAAMWTISLIWFFMTIRSM